MSTPPKGIPALQVREEVKVAMVGHDGPVHGPVDPERARWVASELTDRECEVLRLVAGGMTNREVASTLHISPHTVGRHLQNLFTKLGVTHRNDLVGALRQGDAGSR